MTTRLGGRNSAVGERRRTLKIVFGVVGGLLLVAAAVAAFAPFGPWPSDSQSYCGAILNPPSSADSGSWCDPYRTGRWILVLVLIGVGALAVGVAVRLSRASGPRAINS
jgi:hypothetical protein